jgi:O-antigen/teichoic acid export membrane protein
MRADAIAGAEIAAAPEAMEVETVLAPVAANESAPTAIQKWLPILVRFTSVQAVVQALGLVAGILIVRALPKREYAFYTIGNTMLATILLLADSGISSALTAIGGRVWQDNRRLASLLATALQLRRQLAMVTIVIVVPVLIWLLVQNGANALATAGLVVAVLAGSGLELITRIYAVALRLRSEIRQIQSQALLAALVKLAAVGIALFVFFNAFIAIVTVVLGYAVQFWMLRRWVSREIDTSAPGDPAMRSEIIAILRRQGPHSLYYCFQTQITVWLISVFGNSDSVANVGALGRLAAVLALLSSVMMEVVLPAFARIRSPNQLRRRYFHILWGYLTLSSVLVGVVAVFPSQILSILGRQYSDLRSDGILMAACAVVSTIAGLLWAINASRAWIVSPLLLIPCTIVVQAVSASVLDLSTVKGVLLLTIYSWVPSIVLSVSLAVKKMWPETGVAV